MEYTTDPDWPQNDVCAQRFAPRNVIHSWATDTEDTTVDPRWGPVGFQRIEDDGPLLPERQRIVENEVTGHTIDFIERSVAEDAPFLVWMAPARAHVWTHLSPDYEAMPGNGRGFQDVVMRELDDNVGKVLDRIDALGVDTAPTRLLLFGGPGPGGRAMAKTPTPGPDAFCQRLLVVEAEDGQVRVLFNDLLALADRQGVPKNLALRVINRRLVKTFNQALDD